MTPALLDGPMVPRNPVLPSHAPLLIASVGDWVVSDQPGITLATYALGSGIGIAAWDPLVRCGGLLHFMLPEASLNPDKARLQPGVFCDTGLDGLLKELEAWGAYRRRLRVVLAGGAKVLPENGSSDAGRRNLLAARRRLWEAGLAVEDEACGGELSRTLKLDLSTGRASVRDSLGARELSVRRAPRS